MIQKLLACYRGFRKNNETRVRVTGIARVLIDVYQGVCSSRHSARLLAPDAEALYSCIDVALTPWHAFR